MTDDYRRLGADRKPFRVGETVMVTVVEYKNTIGGPTYQGWIGLEYDRQTQPVRLATAIVVTAPGPVGSGHTNETPGYTVVATLPDGERALKVDKLSLWRPEHAIVVAALLAAQQTMSMVLAHQDAEVAAVFAKHAPNIDAARAEVIAKRNDLRAATMPKLRDQRKHPFQPNRFGVYCRKSNCGKRDTDPIHSSK